MTEIVPSQTSPDSLLRRVFFYRGELRVGWRLLVFLLISSVLVIAAMSIASKLRPGLLRVSVLTPGLVLALAAIRFAAVLLATFLMSCIERRKLGSYGLPLSNGFLRDLAYGALWGITAVSALLGVMWIAHGFRIESLAESGANLLLYAAFWGAAFILVGLAEEFSFRGYAQFTLAKGIGFWPAAMVLSLCFAGVHYANGGENLLGLFEVVLIALFFCLTLWCRGTLWFAVGYHAAWDWAQTCLYGTADSGVPSAHHLLNSSSLGPAWLTGGSVGPEGSVLNIPLNLLVAVLFYYAYARKARLWTMREG